MPADDVREQRPRLDRQYLALVLPVLYVFKIAAATGINGRARLDEEVCRRDNIDDGRASGILAGDPEGNRDIVVCTAVSNGEKAVKTEQEVRASVVKGWEGQGGR